jgi:hypothetical protein
MMFVCGDGVASSVPDDVLGIYEGGGRACYGKLVVRRHNLSRHTPFAACMVMPFAYSEGHIDADQNWFVMSIKPRSSKCPFRQLVLERKVLASGNVRWAVIGFESVADEEASRVDKALNCSLFRLDN